MYGELVYRIGKQYSQMRECNPDVEFPYFAGQISAIVTEDIRQELLELQGEYLIAYNDGNGTSHLIRLYLDKGLFEAEGTPPLNGLSMSSSTNNR